MLLVAKLKEFKFFNGLEDDFLEEMAIVASLKDYKKGEYIFKEGDDSDFLYIVEKGKVALETRIYSEKVVRLATVRKDDYFGWSSVVEPYKCTASRYVLEDTTCLLLNGKVMREACKNNTKLGYFLMEKVAKMISIQLKKTREQLIYSHFGQREVKKVFVDYSASPN
ncbi:MAG: Crp/Fnr family transcriptional regulator [Calditrichaeota bacterium]|nr:MAG: Crp/Fnr family transcriptional regulator [Calditrichota bacterium]